MLKIAWFALQTEVESVGKGWIGAQELVTLEGTVVTVSAGRECVSRSCVILKLRKRCWNSLVHNLMTAHLEQI
jgi:hypothetical protein